MKMMNSYEIIETGKFRKDLKKFLKNPVFFEEIATTIEILEQFGAKGIPEKMVPHKLKGNWENHWECHIRPDLLMIWFQIDEPNKLIYLERIGSHSDLFK